MAESSRQFTHGDYTVGWICALPETELVAAAAMLDEEHPVLPAADPHDTNSYLLGKIGDHNVVIACLPAETTGKVSAATVAKDMLRSFPAVRFGLMVGIGGGAPYYGAQGDDNTRCGEDEEEEDDSEDDSEDTRDIRLGDVVISLHSKSAEAVVQYDFGKSLQKKDFVHTGGKLNKPPAIVLSAVAMLQQQHKRKGHNILKQLAETLSKNIGMAGEFQCPGLAKDRLFKSNVIHVEGRKSCKACCGPNNVNLVRRKDRDGTAPRIHYGTIGSADQVMKDAILRDKWARKEKIICFEMEAAGLMDSFPCLVIRGICDYADSHKNKIWQPYAAITAALYAKELLLVIPGQGVMNLLPIKQLFNRLAGIEENIIETKHAIVSSQEEEFRAKVLSWISPLDYTAKQNDIIARRKSDTGTWLLKCRTFENWMETPRQTLFCPGIPGAGKTIMASVIIDHLQQVFRNKSTGISYIYCVYNEVLKAKDLVGSMVKQLTAQLPSLPKEVRELYYIHEGQKTSPQRDDLIQTVASVASNFSKVFIVIDAMDEYQDEDSRIEFLESIKKIKSFANILVTSRPVGSIKEIFNADLQEEIRATREDITTYVKSEISRENFVLSSEISSKAELKSHIVNQIVSMAEGMFLHAQFHVKYLAQQDNIRDLRETLADLPKTSDDIYDKAMERVKNQNEKAATLAEKLLLWIVGASRPLQSQEIQHALALREGDKEVDDEALTAPKHLLSICAGLVIIDEQSNVIRLVHHTAQEYFKDNQLKYFPGAQVEIARTCLRYLSLEVFSDAPCSTDELYERRLATNALFEYAAKNWGKHIHGEIEHMVGELALRLLRDERKVSCATQALFVNKSWFTAYSQQFPKEFYGIHYASYLGLGNIVHLLLMNLKMDVNSMDSYGRTPLSYAAENGHETVVKILLERGAAVDSMDAYGRTPLLYAAIRGYETAVKTLLERGAAVDSVDTENGRTPLSWAAISGYETVVKILLERGAAVDSMDEYGRTPLSYAAENGHETVVKILLERGAAVDSMDAYGRTPLSWAAIRGHEAAVKTLLERGAAVDSVDTKNGRTPLSYAAEYGYETVVKILLERGAAVDSVDTKNGRTPLSYAAEYGYETVVKILLERGAAVDSMDDYGQTPLSYAADNGHETVVKILLERGAAVDSVDTENGRTPLSYAAEYGYETAVKTLLERGAAVDSVDTENGRTPLSWAAIRGHEAAVKTLLERGAAVDSVDTKNGRTPLSYAAECGYETVVKILLERGAAVDSVDINGQTPLSYAAENGYKAVMKILLERGAVVDLVDTGLWLATSAVIGLL